MSNSATGARIKFTCYKGVVLIKSYDESGSSVVLLMRLEYSVIFVIVT